MAEFQEELPIKATSKTVVSLTELNQVISFYYDDPTEIYYSYIKADLLDDLLDELTTNMQNFVSSDVVKINGERIPLLILEAQIKFHKKKRSEPVVIFTIRNDSSFQLLQGENIISLEADPEILDYPISSTWRFPGKVLRIKSPLKYKMSGFNVFFSANTADQIGGSEMFVFTVAKAI